MIFETIWRKDIKLKNLDAYIEIYFDNYTTTPRYECSTNFSTKNTTNIQIISNIYKDFN